MSPVAIELTQDTQKTSSPGPALVIGSPLTAQDGTYLDLINDLEKRSANASEVEKQMVDRILDGGELFTSISSALE